MGQYYKCVTQSTTGAVHGFQSTSVKLMEFGYLYNDTMLEFTTHLTTTDIERAVIVGDYCETPALAHLYETECERKRYNPNEPELSDDEWATHQQQCEQFVVLNHTKSEMVNLATYAKQKHNAEPGYDDGMTVHPIALLLCTERGGGGDYHHLFRGRSLDEGGEWMGDRVTAIQTTPDTNLDISAQWQAKGYVDITASCICQSS